MYFWSLSYQCLLYKRDGVWSQCVSCVRDTVCVVWVGFHSECVIEKDSACSVKRICVCFVWETRCQCVREAGCIVWERRCVLCNRYGVLCEREAVCQCVREAVCVVWEIRCVLCDRYGVWMCEREAVCVEWVRSYLVCIGWPVQGTHKVKLSSPLLQISPIPHHPDPVLYKSSPGLAGRGSAWEGGECMFRWELSTCGSLLTNSADC
jgi:hypothetical protein